MKNKSSEALLPPPEDCSWIVHSCSSESHVHTAVNVLKEELFRIWQTQSPSDEAWIVLQPSHPVAFRGIEIVNAGSALVEVFGLRAAHGQEVGGDQNDYEMLLPAQQVMTVKDLVSNSNRSRSFDYDTTHKLAPLAAEQRWRQIRVLCRQPFGTEDHKACIGLSRIRITMCRTQEEMEAEAAEARLQQDMKTGLAEMFPCTKIHNGDMKVSQVTRPKGHSLTEPKAEQASKVDASVHNCAAISSPIVKRRMPLWSSPCEPKQTKGSSGRKNRGSDDEAIPSQEEAVIQEDRARESPVNPVLGIGANEEGHALDNCHAVQVSENKKGKDKHTRRSTIACSNHSKLNSTKLGDEAAGSFERGGQTAISPGLGVKARNNSVEGNSGMKAQSKNQTQDSKKGNFASETDRNKGGHGAGDLFSHGIVENQEQKHNEVHSGSDPKVKTGNSHGKGKVVNIEVKAIGESSGEYAGVLAQGSNQAARPFSKLLDGVVLAISGIVNPERANIREKALEMGAQYRPDWSNDCTMLVCAFSNTPKFRQVKAENGTIVSKDWIPDCHEKRALVEIDTYMMHAGKPWRQTNVLSSVGFEEKTPEKQTFSSPTAPFPKSHGSKIDQNEKYMHSTRRDSSSTRRDSSVTKDNAREIKKTFASLLDVKKWVHEDLDKTKEWLQQQDEQPEAEELETTATQGVVLCLEDTIKGLKEGKSVKSILDSWAFVPRAVRELGVLEEGKKGAKIMSREELLHEAERLKWIYEDEYRQMERERDLIFFCRNEGKHSLDDTDRQESQEDDATELMSNDGSRDAMDWESDATIELDESCIKRAQQNVICSLRNMPQNLETPAKIHHKRRRDLGP